MFLFFHGNEYFFSCPFKQCTLPFSIVVFGDCRVRYPKKVEKCVGNHNRQCRDMIVLCCIACCTISIQNATNQSIVSQSSVDFFSQLLIAITAITMQTLPTILKARFFSTEPPSENGSSQNETVVMAY